MRIARPGTGTILGGLALFVALGGTAAAAAPTVVNIADPAAPAQKAKVGAEIVVDGYTVTASAVPAAAHVHVKGAQKQQ